MTTNFIDVSSDSVAQFVSDPRRKAPRKAVLIPGEVSFGDKATRLICRVVDMSATGARLRLETLLDGPASKNKQLRDRIGLYFEREKTNVECKVIWINDVEMGVQFCSMMRRNSPQPRSIYGSID